MNSEISRTLALIESIKSELEIERCNFVELSKLFATNKSNDFIREAIITNASKVKELGMKGLAPIKRRIEEAFLCLDSFVEIIISDDSLWLYKQDVISSDNCPIGSYRISGNKFPDIINEPLRMIFSPIGIILLSNGLVPSKYWEKRDSIVLCQEEIDWNKELKDSMRIFNSKFDDMVCLLKTIENLKAQKESKEALELWNKI